ARPGIIPNVMIGCLCNVTSRFCGLPLHVLYFALKVCHLVLHFSCIHQANIVSPSRRKNWGTTRLINGVQDAKCRVFWKGGEGARDDRRSRISFCCFAPLC